MGRGAGVAMLALALLATWWVLQPDGPPTTLDPSAAQATNPDDPEAATPDPTPAEADDDPTLGAAAPIESIPDEEARSRDEELEGFVVTGQVLDPGNLGSLQARLVYGDAPGVEDASWWFSPGLAWAKPQPLDEDGRFRFARAYDGSFKTLAWRVEIGVTPEDGDEFRGRTPLLVLGNSEAFRVTEGAPVAVAQISVQPPISLTVPLHDFHLIDDDHLLQGEFERRPTIWHGRPTRWIHARDGAQIERRIRLSPFHAGQRFRVLARSSTYQSDPASKGPWFLLQPGEHRLDVLRPPALGLVEVIMPGTQALLEAEARPQVSHQLKLRLVSEEAKNRSSRSVQVTYDPAESRPAYDPSWGTRREPAAAWQDDSFVARIPAVPAGRWQLSVEAPHLGRMTAPLDLNVAPFDVTRARTEWLGEPTRLRVVPTPPGASLDEYVLNTWAALPQGRAHAFGATFIGSQQPRWLQVPPETVAVGSVSHWHGTPTEPDGAGSRLLFYRGALEDRQGEDLPIRRAGTRYRLEFPLDANVTGGHLAELRARGPQLDGQTIAFRIRGNLEVDLIGFPPGFYDVRLAREARESTEAEFRSWDTIEIRSQPNQDRPGSEDAGN